MSSYSNSPQVRKFQARVKGVGEGYGAGDDFWYSL